MVSGMFLALSAVFSQTPFVERLVHFEISGVAFSAPSEWVAQTREGAARFDTPEGDAFIDLEIQELTPFQGPTACVDQMMTTIVKEGWERISVDKHPAVRWMGTEPGNKEEIPSAEEAERLALGQSIDTRVTAIWIMGCNGARRWLLKMSAKTRDAGKYGPTFRRVRESFKYKVHANLGAKSPPAKNR